MKKDFFEWFSRTKIKSKADNEREYVEHYGEEAFLENFGEEYVEPDAYAFDRFTGDKIDGTTKKAIVMLKGKHLMELYDEVKGNPDCAYVACANDFIRNSTRKEFENFPVSIIAKNARLGDPDYNRAELIYSRLCNIFRVKTAFVMPLTDDLKTIASVDMLSILPDKNGNESIPAEDRGQEITPINDLNGRWVGRADGISSWIRLIKSINENEWRLESEHIERIIYNLIKTYIVRSLIFRDEDMHGYNVGIVHSSDYKYVELGACYDLEFCGWNSMFYGREKEEHFLERRRQDMQYLLSEYPEYLSIIMDEINSIGSGKFDQILSVFERFSSSKEHAAFWADQIKRNMNALNSIIESIKASQNEM